MAQTILTLHGQIDSLATVALQNWRGLGLLTTERWSLSLSLSGKNVVSLLNNQV